MDRSQILGNEVAIVFLWFVHPSSALVSLDPYKHPLWMLILYTVYSLKFLKVKIFNDFEDFFSLKNLIKFLVLHRQLKIVKP